MATGERIRFDLRCGELAETDVSVSRVEGTEGLSEPYRFAVELAPAPGRALDLGALLGAEASLAIRRPGGEERWVHGEAVRVELTGVAAGAPRYRIEIAPRLERLGSVARSRIFQGKSVPEIADEVLGEHGVVRRASLSGSYPAREIAVQRRETDLDFLSRLLEAEGIWYRFEHSAGGHEMVLGDAAGAFAERDGALAVRPESGQGDGVEHLFRLAAARRVTSTRAARRDFDFERPSADLDAVEGEGALEVYEYPGGHREAGEGRRLARARLEDLRYGAATFEAAGNVLGAVPGTKVEVDGAGPLVVVRARHAGAQERAAGALGGVRASYENRFEAIAADRQYRPRRRTSAPRVAGIETATVVGSAGEEIHTDGHGRVKVRFHWDREGASDDRASCWIRVAQPWAGAGMGASRVPRVGQEVVVRFLDGDPDRPLVVGAVYNGANEPPVALPSEKTKATVRSASSPGSDGSNELRYEDAAGSEEVYVHAQRDEQVAVEADASAEVRANETVRVEKDRAREIVGGQRLQVGADDSSAVGASQTLTVAGSRATSVGASHAEQVGGANAVTVAGGRHVRVAAASAESVGGAAALNVGGGYAVNVAGVHNQLVAGLKSTEVAGASVEAVGGHREERVAGEATRDVRGDHVLHVDGALGSSVDGDASDDVGGRLVTVAGPLGALAGRTVELRADSAAIEVGGRRVVTIDSAGNVQWTAAGNVTIDGSAIELSGATIKKIGPSGTESSADWVEIELLDENGDPAANQEYELHLGDGSVRKGRLDGSGKARVDGLPPGACRVVFPAPARRN